MDDRAAALKYLEGDEVLNIDMISAISRGSADILYAAPDGVFAYERASGALMLSIDDEKKGLDMLEQARDFGGFYIRNRVHFNFLREKYPDMSHMECYQAVYRGGKIELPRTLEIRALDGQFASEVGLIYGGEGSEYALERLREGAIFGGFEEGRLVGFIGTHDEGSIGLLKILPEFRGRGFAKILSGFMINRELEHGRKAFSQVKIDNEVSIELHKRMGMELSDRPVFTVY